MRADRHRRWMRACALACAFLGCTWEAPAGDPGEAPQEAEGAPQTRPGPSRSQADQPQTQPDGPQTAPQTRPRSRRDLMLELLKARGLEPPEPRVRYEKGSFMITGSMEIDPRVYDGKPVVEAWIKEIEALWKPRIPLAAKMGNSGRVTFKGVLMREKGITDLEKVEPSGLDSFDEAATQALEEFRSSFTMPTDFPADFVVFYLKFHYNIYSKD